MDDSSPVPWRQAFRSSLKVQCVLVAFLAILFVTMQGPDNPVFWSALLLLQFPGSLLMFPAWGLQVPDALQDYYVGSMFGAIVLMQWAMLALLFRKPWRRSAG